MRALHTLTGTVGLLITYLCYQSMNYRGIAFSVPILPVSAAVLLVLAVCVAVPVLAYRLLAGIRLWNESGDLSRGEEKR